MRKLCPSGYVARISRRQNTGHIPGKKSAANKRVYTGTYRIFTFYNFDFDLSRLFVTPVHEINEITG